MGLPAPLAGSSPVTVPLPYPLPTTMAPAAVPARGATTVAAVTPPITPTPTRGATKVGTPVLLMRTMTDKGKETGSVSGPSAAIRAPSRLHQLGHRRTPLTITPTRSAPVPCAWAPGGRSERRGVRPTEMGRGRHE